MLDVASHLNSNYPSRTLGTSCFSPLRRALEGIPEEDGAQPANQAALANRLAEVLVEYGAG